MTNQIGLDKSLEIFLSAINMKFKKIIILRSVIFFLVISLAYWTIDSLYAKKNINVQDNSVLKKVQKIEIGKIINKILKNSELVTYEIDIPSKNYSIEIVTKFIEPLQISIYNDKDILTKQTELKYDEVNDYKYNLSEGRNTIKIFNDDSVGAGSYEIVVKPTAEIDEKDNVQMSVEPQKKNKISKAVFKGNDERKRLSLTFDDGPDGVVTPMILDYLAQYKVKATFFVCGNLINSNKEVLRRIYNEGHLVANHSYNHPDLKRCSNEKVINELNKTSQLIESVINRKPAFFRPPYGSFNSKTTNILNDMQMINVIWSIDTLDWRYRYSQRIASSVTSNVKNGDIILMHCNGDKRATAESLPIIFNILIPNGWEFVDLSELLDVDGYLD